MTGKAAEGVALQLRSLVAPPALLLLVALARHRRCLGAGCSGAAGTAGIARAEHLLQVQADLAIHVAEIVRVFIWIANLQDVLLLFFRIPIIFCDLIHFLVLLVVEATFKLLDLQHRKRLVDAEMLLVALPCS